MRWRIVLILWVWASAGLVGGCDKPQSRQADSGPPPLTQVRVGYFANVTHAQAILAVASGDFQTAVAPARLVSKVFNAGPSLIEALIAGEIDIGYVGPGPALTAWSATHGQEITVIAGAAANGVVIVAGPKSNIHSMRDLAGKKIATPQRNNTQDISARHYVTSVLNESDDRDVKPIGNPEQVGRMLAGDIDAAWVPEPWGSRLVALAGGTIIGEEKDLWPDHQFSLTVVVARTAFLRRYPGVVTRVLAAHHQWTKNLSAAPGAYASQLEAALFDLTKTKWPPGVLEASLKHVIFTDDPMKGTFDAMEKWSVDLRVIEEPVSLNGLIDTTLIHGLP